MPARMLRPISILSLVLISLSMTSLPAAAAECPIASDGETALDCPWAGIARDLQSVAATNGDVGSAFAAAAPMIERQLERDRARKEWLALWGRSINFDELAGGVIVEPKLLDHLFSRADVHAREERIVHAGVEHTYGYLFSILKTPYGFKRARWVQDDIEAGFGLKRGTLGPNPESGTLLANLTYFIGSIAFRDHAPIVKSLYATSKGIAPELKRIPFDRYEITRVEEVLSAPRAVTLRTDLVKFPKQREGKTNTHLLVYSILDPASDAAHPVKLISAFPVSAQSVAGTLQGAGDDVVIKTRYNAFVSGITDSQSPLKGVKRILAPAPRAAR